MLMHPTIPWLIHADFDAGSWYGYRTKMSSRNHTVSFVKSQHHVINPANPSGALDDSVKYRLHVRGRAADDAKHLGGCGLMLQGLAQFRVALLDLLEQTHIF